MVMSTGEGFLPVTNTTQPRYRSPAMITYCKGNLFEAIAKHYFDIKPENLVNGIAIAQVCNNVCKFGAGFAAETASRFPFVQKAFLEAGQQELGTVRIPKTTLASDKHMGLIFAIPSGDNSIWEVEKYSDGSFDDCCVNNYGEGCMPLFFINMIAQAGTFHDPSNLIPLRYEYLRQCFKSTREFAERRNCVLMPKIGTGLARGDWNVIYQIINQEWPNVNIFVYELEGK
jgi:O-acetyl-ADP-ribose deacetylase (regulator of RNase III)